MQNPYSISNLKKIRWGVLEENQPISLYPCMYPGWSGIIQKTGKILGKPQKNIINLNRKNSGIIFVDHQEWTALGEYGLKKIVSKPSWGLKLNKKILKLSDELVKYSNQFKNNLNGKTTRQLYALYKTYLDKHSQLYNQAIVPVYLDLYKPHLTTYLTDYLNRLVKNTGFNLTGRQCFTMLTVPENFSKVQEQEIALLRLAIKKFNVKNALKNHALKYEYLGYNFEGPAFPDKYFQDRLKQLRQDKISPKVKLQNLRREKLKAKATVRLLVKNLKIDKRHQLLLELTRGFIYSKDYRKMSLVESYFLVEPLLKELSKRLKLSLAQIRNCLLEEIKDMAEGKISQPKDLAKRMQGCLFVVVDKNLPGRVFVDHTFRQMEKYLLKKQDLGEVNYFHGQPACLGKAKGRVKIINSAKDLGKMKPGDILVSHMTNPDLLPAMKKAAAIVTDLGGITSHAAIVSRELNVPCIIGTKIATKALKDGDVVEVDANSGDVKKIS